MKCLHLLSDTYPPLVFPTMHMLVEAVNLHVISSSWDLQFLSCLSESTRSKSAVLNINANMKEGGMRNIMCNGTKATKTGKLFYDTIKVSYFDWALKHTKSLLRIPHVILSAIKSNFTSFLSQCLDWTIDATRTWSVISLNTAAMTPKNFLLWKKSKH